MKCRTFQEVIRRLSEFWEKQGCIINQGYDLEVGAGTFNPATYLRCLGPEPYNTAYVEACRRPTDGRYGENPNRVQHYFQYQVVLKPSPLQLQELYLKSLEAIGFDLSKHDIRFVHDDWESPTLGAWGLGWEVWMDGMEVTQFTYFQAAGGQPLKPISGELTYGLERLSMYLLAKDNIFDLPWNENFTYGDIYHRSEVEWSQYNFEEASTELWFRHFEDYEKEAHRLCEMKLPLPAYDFVMKASHAFNLLDARGVISVTERTAYIHRIRDLAMAAAAAFLASREEQGYPLKDIKQAFLAGSQITPAAEALPIAKDPTLREDFVFEIGSEELPATFVPLGCRNLETDLKRILEKLGLAYDSIRTCGTPRRLTAYVSGLAHGKPAQSSERRGPAVDRSFDSAGKPTPAAAGFFRSIGVDAPDLKQIESGEVATIKIKEVKGSKYLFVTIEESGQSTTELLAAALPKLILDLDFPKKMRWSDLDISYARPLRWILALHGNQVVPFTLANLASGRKSAGHRQLCPGDFKVASAREYFEALRAHKVIVDIEERKENILGQIQAIEAKISAKIAAVNEVLPQVLHLAEWPQLTPQTFDESFLKVPKEVLISEMVEHQKYFPVEDASGSLINTFIITADNTPTEYIREGNSKVLSARLSDGTFLYEQDLKAPLDSFLEKLKSITFLRGMGSMYEKAQRLVKHVEVLHEAFSGNASLEHCKRAALLSKADLASAMVYEFPELQGVMGRYYALAHNEAPEVAEAIHEHWMPIGESAPLPQSSTGAIVALADKLDKLIACFAAGQKPKSSSDPHALRRQVLGIIKILIEHKMRLDLPAVLERCTKAFSEDLLKDRETVCKDILEFITNRIRSVFQDFGLNKDETEASLTQGWRDIYDSFLKVQALNAFRSGHQSFSLLMEVHKRAKGQIAEQAVQTLQPELLTETSEQNLNSSLNGMEEDFHQAIQQGAYAEAYTLIAKLQPNLAQLFEEVKILSDDIETRQNRIALLQRVFGLFEELVDFDKIQKG